MGPAHVTTTLIFCPDSGITQHKNPQILYCEYFLCGTLISITKKQLIIMTVHLLSQYPLSLGGAKRSSIVSSYVFVCMHISVCICMCVSVHVDMGEICDWCNDHIQGSVLIMSITDIHVAYKKCVNW